MAANAVEEGHMSEAPRERIIVRETAADRARRKLVGLAVGPSRPMVLAAIGSAAIFIAALIVGFLTRK